MKNKAARRYLRQVKLHLFCNRAHRQALLSRAQTMIEEFSEERPEAEYKDFVAAFGPPQSFAENMMEGIDQQEIDQVKRNLKWALRLAVAALLLSFALISAFWYAKWQKAQEVVRGDFKIVEILYEPVFLD